MDMRIFESLRRQQLVTEYIIYPASDIENYQVLLTGVPSSSKEDVLVVSNKKILPHWVESKGSVWTKIPKLVKNTPLKIYTLTGNPSAVSASNITNTMLFGDDFPGSALDSGKWDTDRGSPTVSNNILTINNAGISSKVSCGINTILELNFNPTATGGTVSFGYFNVVWGGNMIFIQLSGTTMYTDTRNPTVTEVNRGAYTTGNKNYKFKRISTSSVDFIIDTTLYTHTTTIPTTDIPIRIYTESAVNYYIGNLFVRKYASPEPIIQKIRTSNKSLLLKELMR